VYDNSGAVLGSVLGGGAGAGALAVTGVDALWLPLAAFAMVAAGMALLRTLPKRVQED
jgi:4-hydroxybenzoate polyprenyltransferase